MAVGGEVVDTAGRRVIDVDSPEWGGGECDPREVRAEALRVLRDQMNDEGQPVAMRRAAAAEILKHMDVDVDRADPVAVEMSDEELVGVIMEWRGGGRG